MVKRNSPKEISIKVRDPETKEIEEYKMKVPIGELGWKHFRMMMELDNEKKNTIKEMRKDNRQFITIAAQDPKTKEWKERTIENPNFEKDVEVELPNPRLDALMMETMEKWVHEIMPEILISHKIEDLEWRMFLPIFESVCTNTSIDATSFPDPDGEGV